MVDSAQTRRRVTADGKKDLIVSRLDVNVDIRWRGGRRREERNDPDVSDVIADHAAKATVLVL